jgi:protein-tyrosine-phosphatase
MSSILFVCTANRIRSVFAEYLFRRHLEKLGKDLSHWQIASAGTWTSAGLPAMPKAIEAGASLGLDLTKHRSTPVEEVDLTSFDLVVIMEQGQREALLFEVPTLGTRARLLSELGTGLAYDVADPVGGPLSGYLDAANEIDRLLSIATPQIVEMIGA